MSYYIVSYNYYDITITVLQTVDFLTCDCFCCFSNNECFMQGLYVYLSFTIK